MKQALLLACVCAVMAVSSATGMSGAPVPISDLTNTVVVTAAEKAIEEINLRSNSLFKTVLVEVTGGTVQVVQGVKYVLTFRVGRALFCKNNGEPATLRECPVSKDSIESWKATIWVRVWLSADERYIVEGLSKVQEQQQKSRLVGAPVALEDPTDKEVVAAASMAVEELNRKSNSQEKLMLVEVLGGTVQVVNGVNYSLKLAVGMSTCKNDGKPTTLKMCPVVANTLETWHAVILRYPSTPPTYNLLQLNKVVP